MTWDQWLHWAHLKLKKSISPKRDAEIILSQITKKSRTQLLAFGESLLKYETIIQLRSLIYRRSKGEPIAYLVGSKEFWSLNLKVAPGTFIPRPDTECLVRHVFDLLKVSHLNVLDLGTGVGTIALALASERPNWKITGVDCQKQALFLAHSNKLLLDFKNVKFIYGNWFKYLIGKKFNLIVSNPPYIDKNDPCLQSIDMIFEPQNTLVSQQKGLKDLTVICKYSTQHLRQNGWLVLEHGWNQGNYIRTLFLKYGFTHIHTIRDYHHYERVTYGKWKSY
ncbi:peptide chain release factor N(5)-glutamine methyltransferase [Blochmannia endosymbiont of Camponotus sp. C-003]|uniref:peptide chain release factor N(5)-glutamine methyltransferase n=1 Tax=unclassified Candidatus Blochmanniella TaxID=711328 RepID=UPI00202523BD|nr:MULTISPECIES: peptide chain release factor N(5)-glutamine methyltransferase [unclassified Candidatus Blochmannia]URJ23464.1 peptide chain release factor N(5)-glutamine methyltransferase [Blochmannia endosymbiont of Camponotus sp. C-003]URJ28936.1 peptide chain release factor N(5)-glutamine methyltransferase [Blochmannia endosymbiont of Camponotus sp. C-046]